MDGTGPHSWLRGSITVPEGMLEGGVKGSFSCGWLLDTTTTVMYWWARLIFPHPPLGRSHFGEVLVSFEAWQGMRYGKVVATLE